MNHEGFQEGQEESIITKLGEERTKKLSLTEILEQKLCVIFSVLVEELKVPTSVACIEIVVSFLQIFGFAYQQDEEAHEIDQYRNDVSSMFYVFRFYKPIEERENNSTLYFTVAYLLFSVQILYFILMFAVLKYEASGKKRLGFVVQIECFLTHLIYWVLLNPTTEFYTSIFYCSPSTGKHLAISDMECWTLSHFIHIIVFSILFLVYAVNITLICLLGNDSNPYHEHNAFRRFSWSFELLYASYRTIFSVLCVILMNADMDWTLDIAFLVCSVVFVVLYARRAVYYDKTVCKVFGACLISSVWIFINESLYEIGEAVEVRYGGRTITAMAGLALMYVLASKVQTHYVSSLIKEQSSVSLGDDTDVEVFLHKIIELELGMDRSVLSAEDRMFLHGYIFIHRSECKKPECPMNAETVYYLPLNKQYSHKESLVFDDHVRIKHLIQRIYRDKMRSSSSKSRLDDSSEVVITSLNLLLACAYYQIYVIGNYYTASCQLDRAGHVNEALSARCTILQARRAIKVQQEAQNLKKMVQNGGRYEALDFRLIFEYEAYFAQLKRKLFAVAELQKKFCAELLLPNPDLNTVHQHGMQMIEYCEEASNAWTQLKEMDCLDVKAEILYALYLTNVRSKQSEASEHIRMAKILGEKKADTEGLDLSINKQAMFAEDAAVIAMGTTGDISNKIIKASNGITHIFEYAPADIVGKDITTLMPAFLREDHASFTAKSLNTGKYTILNQVVESYGVDKEQYLFKLHICVRQYFDLVRGVIFLGLLKPSPKEEATIITDMDGKILGISYDVYEMLHELTPTLLREQDVYLFYICPNFYQDLHEKEYSEYVGAMEFTFCVPKNLQAVSQAINAEHALLRARGNPEKIEEVFKKSYGDMFDYSIGGRVRRWCSVRDQSAGDGKVKFKIISFTRAEANKGGEVFAREHGSGMVVDVLPNIELAIESDSHRFDQQKLTLDLKAATRLRLVATAAEATPDFESPAGGDNTARLRELINSNGDMKNVLFSIYSARIRDQIQSTPRNGNIHHPEARSKETAENKDLEASSRLDNTERRLISPRNGSQSNRSKAPGSPTKRLNLHKTGADTGTSEDSGQKTPSSGEKAPTQASLEKELGGFHSSSFRGYSPRSIRYLNWGMAVFLLIFLSMGIAHFATYVFTLGELRSLGEMTTWTRTRHLSAIYEAVRSLTMLSPSADGLPLLSVERRAPYNYATIGYEGEAAMNYNVWKLRDLKTFTDTLIEIDRKIQIHYIGVTAKKSAMPDSIEWKFFSVDGTKQYTRNVMMHTLITMITTQAINIYTKLGRGSTDIATEARLVLVNALSGVLNVTQTALADSLEIVSPAVDQEKLVSLIMLCATLAASGLFLAGLAPILYHITEDKSKMLQLLIAAKSRSIKTQIENCAKFASFLHLEGGAGENREEEVEKDDNEEDAEAEDGRSQTGVEMGYNEEDKLVPKKVTSKKKKAFVEYRGRFFPRILTILLAFIVIDTYSLYGYLKPPVFFNKIEYHLQDIACMQAYMSYNYLYYTMMVEMFASNGTLMGTMNAGMAFTMIKVRFADAKKEFLEYHRRHVDAYTAKYDNIFSTLLLGSPCQVGVVSNIRECQTIKDTIMDKGLLFATDAHIETMIRIIDDYLAMPSRTLAYTRAVLNGKEMIQVEKVFRKYILVVFKYITSAGVDSIYSAIDLELPTSAIVFTLFISVLLGMYLFLWRLYIIKLRQDLFSSKLLFSYLPLEMIVENPQLADCVMEYVRELTNNIQH